MAREGGVEEQVGQLAAQAGQRPGTGAGTKTVPVTPVGPRSTSQEPFVWALSENE